MWIPRFRGFREKVLDEAHKSRYSIHPGTTKMYMKRNYWWPGMKYDVTQYVSKCRTCLQVKVTVQQDSAIRNSETFSSERLSKVFMNEIVARHGVPISIVSDRDTRCRPGRALLDFRSVGSLVCDISDRLRSRSIPTERVPLNDFVVDDTLNYVEEPVAILDRKEKRLRKKVVPIVKVQWKHRKGSKATWEPEAEMREHYPHLFSNDAGPAEGIERHGEVFGDRWGYAVVVGSRERNHG
ncbi:hypothetical protein L1987_23416 [Smallanthus sonchifolius]|uniref:Uncharacterized protein n=1 Tax=Smallanthus sonchifolius TaxID=185202 RepID=A0ACB9II66_9ASTR|nr:hypothetical protein L1987_23416 [Smallanthus sonchifolius]